MRMIRPAAAIAAALTLTLAAAACSSSSTKTGGSGGGSTASGTPTHGGTVTVAWINATPNFIFPLPPATNTDGYNANLTNAMWPLISYAGDGGQSIVNQKESLFGSLNYTNGNKTVTMVLKPWKWSDGQPITSRDFTFVYNLLKANYQNWNAYLPGQFPTDVASVSTTDEHTVVINLKAATSPDFFTDDVLSSVPLLPQHAWDKESTSGAVGDYDQTSAGSKAVYNFLQKQGSDIATFTTNPLWKVVDGPWTLSDFNADGTLYGYTPNKDYSGPVKPYLSHWENQAFTTDTAMLDAMRAGSSVTVGPLPLSDAGQLGALKAAGYSSAPLPIAGVGGISTNLYNAQDGPVFQQLYIRQAMEELINRQQIVQKVYSGYADPGNGPIPVTAIPTMASPLEKSGGPYPYNPSAAIALLKAHGWNVVPNGVTSCQNAGSGPSQCGAGIKAGQRLEFQLLYGSGRTTTEEQEAAIQSSEAQAGIKLDLKGEPFDTLIGTTGVCTASSHAQNCGWQLADLGYNPYPLYPSDQGVFVTGGTSNYGGYSDPTEDNLITATETTSSLQGFLQYEDYTARQLPMLFVPVRGAIELYRSNVHGVTPLNSFSGINTEETWYLTK
jgi:peptide/nickel transport system substrate-binding protein